jgi:type VI secretion system protein ImpH
VEAETREPDPAIVRTLLEEAHRFSFFRAVQILERLDPEAVPIGGGGPPRREAVRLRPDPSFSFPHAAVTGVEALDDGDGGRRFRVTQTLMGLYGVRTPLPEVYAEELLRRGEADDAVRDFLDLFHHRLLSLLYRAWARCRPHVSFRGDAAAPDPVTRAVFALGGLADEALRRAAGVPALGLLRYTVFLARPSRPAEGLERTLSDFLDGEPVRVEPHVLRAVAVPGEQRARLGRSGCTLGEDFCVGERVADRGGKFRLWIGPLRRTAFLSLAPRGGARAAAGALVRLYLVDPLEHDAMLGIVAAERPPFRLGDGPGAPRLGIDTWLCAADAGDSWVAFPGFAARPGGSDGDGPEGAAAAPGGDGTGPAEAAGDGMAWTGAAPAPREGTA